MATRRPARPREEVFAAAMTAIAAQGLAGLTMAGLGKELGMSGGHLLYYFGSKDQLLLETLRWSEAQLGERRSAVLAEDGNAAERLRDFCALYLPTGPGDPRWTLWIEVWGRSQASEEIRSGQAEIEAAWRADLVALLRAGTDAGEFRPVEPDRFAALLSALLDGFGTSVVVGLPGSGRTEALGHVEAFLRDSLLKDSLLNDAPPKDSLRKPGTAVSG
ncbi:TetR/AcrR family transcriptional regulator [Streptacidiphilus fuscans]|uniref:TetR/AcrR family transcriptional regulator n=1 Tax=Streptacidiphilus fuscans TaxID=2789292 RepID=A0A931B5P7_9ACTN|nr:TetR/AcrR family transcriptional regulator [Streptacidiphilus fuscans]MBF9070869.1 TetR/AcrR family transcriptional regulator [Streptacidiphilus fuscans]